MSLFSPAQPLRAEARLSPGDVLTSLRGSTYRSVRLASSLAAALLGEIFEHPLGHLRLFQTCHSSFPRPVNVLAPGVLGRLRLSR